MNRAKSLLLGVAVLVCGVALNAMNARAGCWTCEEEESLGGPVYVCVGLGVGESGWAQCQPGASYYGDIWCKLSVPVASCYSGGGGIPCPGCRRYPVIRWEPDGSLESTRLAIFERNGDANQVVSRDGGGDAEFLHLLGMESSDATAARTLVAYGATSSRLRTHQAFVSAQGQRISLDVVPVGEGFAANLTVSNASGSASSRQISFLSSGQAITFPVTIDGVPCDVVVNTTSFEGEDAVPAKVAKTVHTPFMAAAEHLASGGTVQLSPLDAATAIASREATTVRALGAGMLMSGLLASAR